jgi:acetyltransferase-like isoleucine patch superfamily enzyme
MIFNNLNIRVSPKASIGRNVRIGDNTVIYDNVVVEDDVTISHNCVVGEPLNDYYTNPEYKNPQTVIGEGSLIRSHSIIYAGNKLQTGHRITLRENNIIGDHTVIGLLSDIQGNARIGDYCRLYSNVVVSSDVVIGNFVFLYPYVVLTNDPYPPSNDLKGGTIGDYSIIGVHSTVLSGVSIGSNCLIGAGSLVTTSIPDYSLAMGNPAKVEMDIRKYVVVLNKGKMYPWMTRFSRGMPWDGVGFEEWQEESGEL